MSSHEFARNGQPDRGGFCGRFRFFKAWRRPRGAVWSRIGGYNGCGYRRAKRACRETRMRLCRNACAAAGGWAGKRRRDGKPAGTLQQSTVEGAALFNGIAAHALDFDDASSPMSGHPSVALLPCLIALAEARDIEGSRVASAYVVGFETCCKLGRALDLTHYSRG